MMIISVLKATFLIFIAVAVVFWVYSLANWDGVCRNDCKHCPYYEDCGRDEKQDKSEMEDKKNGKPEEKAP